METKPFSFSCEFAIFLSAACGTTDFEQQFECVNGILLTSENEEVSKDKLREYCSQIAEIYVQPSPNGYYELQFFIGKDFDELVLGDCDNLDSIIAECLKASIPTRVCP